MALSNWDTLAFNTNGESCNGIFEHPATKDKIEIYKNWLHIHSSMWKERKGYKFSKPVIALVEKGVIHLSGFEIVAVRGMQHSVMFVAKYSLTKKKKYTTYYVGGIGCSGYKKNQYIGVSKKLFANYLEFLNKVNASFWCEPKGFEKWISFCKKSRHFRFNQGDSYFFRHGVTADGQITEVGGAKKTIASKMLNT